MNGVMSVNGATSVSEPAGMPDPREAMARVLAGQPGHAVAGDVPVSERLDQLAQVPLFRELSPDQLLPLAEAGEVVTFAPHETIVRQGEVGESVYVIVDGRVEVVVRSERDGAATEAVVAWLVAGDALAEADAAMYRDKARHGRHETRG